MLVNGTPQATYLAIIGGETLGRQTVPRAELFGAIGLIRRVHVNVCARNGADAAYVTNGVYNRLRFGKGANSFVAPPASIPMPPDHSMLGGHVKDSYPGEDGAGAGDSRGAVQPGVTVARVARAHATQGQLPVHDCSFFVAHLYGIDILSLVLPYADFGGELACEATRAASHCACGTPPRCKTSPRLQTQDRNATEWLQPIYVNTKQQIADLMTKGLNNPKTWEHLLGIAQIRGGITAEKGNVAPAVLAVPPGLSVPISAAECPACKFNITTPGAQCLCDWS